MNTYTDKNRDNQSHWFLVDAKNKVLGRLASQIAIILMGKHKACYTPHIDTGDFVVVVNAKDILFTGKKLKEKVYYSHSGYPGGLKSLKAKELLKTKPEMILKKAVKGMLPKNKLTDKIIKKLKVYAGNEHPHSAQKPQKLNLFK